ncbi:MAG: pseudouridine-5'-phosphate glycosidase [Spirochaetales bacterium]|jgi:pseudouridine-5'-phosphate glycosidase|nr:pseudouridine-5'-phosphate glycosidase [Spirochaetales bacterium]
MNRPPYLDMTPEVRQALEEGRPVVALESTIISHGMPYPQNIETALEVEQAVRSRGAVPATVAILGGRLKAGLHREELEILAVPGAKILKCSRRDLGFAVAGGLHGGTTVAATMIIASLAGIRIFATGGIGGVHRFAQETFDISADLRELGRTDAAVVCAGAKSILDLPLTMEYLETEGVPVVGFGVNELPAFFTRQSGIFLDWRLDNPEDIAKALKAKWDLGLKGGVLVVNPIPEEDSLPKERIDRCIESALAEARSKGIKGKETTPFLLAKIVEETGGDSLKANIKLVLNNARLAADLACAYSRL